MARDAPRTLSREEARRVYDRIGKLQDSQSFYEDQAVALLLEHGAFERAKRVFELGCGTGRLAERLLANHLPADASYHAVDLSPTMVGIAQERLAPFGDRVRVERSDGSPPYREPTASYDRFVSTYVLDLLCEDDILAVLREAHRMLEPGGLLCLASLSTGSGVGSRAVSGMWSALHRLSPALVGGCRPIALTRFLEAPAWEVGLHERVSPFGVCSEVVVAARG